MNVFLICHLISVFCASEAQMPKNVIHQMNHFFVEEKPFLKFRFFWIHTPRNDCIKAQPTPNNTQRKLEYLHVDCCPHKFVHLFLVVGMPDWHSEYRDKIGADHHVKSVIEEKSKRWRAGLHPVLRFPSGGKKVNRTAKPTVHRQASVQNPQSRDNVVQIWIVVVAQWARLEGHFLRCSLGVEATVLPHLRKFRNLVSGKMRTGKMLVPSAPTVQATASECMFTSNNVRSLKPTCPLRFSPEPGPSIPGEFSPAHTVELQAS